MWPSGAADWIAVCSYKKKACCKNAARLLNINMNMNGSAILSFPQDGTPCIEKWEGKTTETRSVKLNCGDGVQLKNDEYTDFMIMIPPGNSQGWSVVIKTEEPNTYYKSSSKVYDVAAGKILTMNGFALSEVDKATTNSYVENGVYLGEGVQINDVFTLRERKKRVFALF